VIFRLLERLAMRSALFTAIALVVATPTIAVAQTETPAESTSEAQQDVQGMADKLNDPSTQAVLAGALGAAMAAVLDIRVDKMAKALEPLNGGKKIKMKGNTVREIATRDDPKFERKIEDGTKTAVRSAGSLAQALAVMLPELQKAAKKMGDALPNMR
jgi:hypothetical protein